LRPPPSFPMRRYGKCIGCTIQARESVVRNVVIMHPDARKHIVLAVVRNVQVGCCSGANVGGEVADLCNWQ
jgi:hypothetical protein